MSEVWEFLTSEDSYCTVQIDKLNSRVHGRISIMKTVKAMPNVISALTARNRFGKMLDEVDKQRRSFVIEKRGSPKAILLGIQDYIRLAAPEPEILKRIGDASIRRGTDRITMSQIDKVIKSARTSRRRAAS